jgi:DNA-directed RNA polymerase specialized sigma24 family protein
MEIISNQQTGPKRKKWGLTQEAFDSLLTWLDSERDRAGRLYEEIRSRLIKIFICRGCTEAEDLADETINRVAKRVDEVAKTYSGDPALYFYGVANKVHLESLRRKPQMDVALPQRQTDEIGPELNCLEQCLKTLRSENRELVLEYYQEERQAKIANRQRLAQKMGIPLNALRIRAHRIRAALKNCVKECLVQQPAD